MRTLLYEAASSLLTRSKVWTTPRGVGDEARPASRLQAGVTTVARKLAVIMHAMWRGGTDFRFAAAPPAQPEGPATALVEA